MKPLILILSCAILAANALTYVPAVPRLRRDVSELSTNYLPPQQTQDSNAELLTEDPLPNEATHEVLNGEVLPEAAAGVPSEPEGESPVFGDNGYDYKTPTLRRLRDVSHLNLGYLPPVSPYHRQHQHVHPMTELVASPASESTPELEPSTEYLPPVVPKEVEIPSESPTLSNEYLPPIVVKDVEDISTEVTEATPPSNEYLPPTKQEEVETTPSEETTAETEPTTTATAVTETPEVTTEAAPEEETTTAAPVEESAVFAEDGYHYKRPDVFPAELFAIKPDVSIETEEVSTDPVEVSAEYLPPIEEGITEVEGPSNGESAVLSEDGYHYRVIKRRF